MTLGQSTMGMHVLDPFFHEKEVPTQSSVKEDPDSLSGTISLSLKHRWPFHAYQYFTLLRISNVQIYFGFPIKVHNKVSGAICSGVRYN
jgi:hypothetical protein